MRRPSTAAFRARPHHTPGAAADPAGVEVDRVALQLAAEEDLDTETLVPGAMLMLSGAVEQLQRSLLVAEFLSPARHAEYLAGMRDLAGPGRPAEAR